ncbi:MAG: hypothetical protein VXZ40_00760 [Nanoarchaeota archaeon]|nr:hypothetical protein [Nanoarchaeota archaeon]
MVKINTKKITAVGLATLMLGSPLAAFANETTTTIGIDTTVEVDISDLEENIVEVDAEVESNTSTTTEDSDLEENTTIEVETEVESETEIEVEDTTQEVEEEIQEELTEKEKEYFSTEEGAALRWEQLSLQLEARVENSELLIAKVDVESGVTVEELERIHLEFQSILDEVKAVDVEASSSSDLALLYVNYKKEIITLTQEFKVEYSKGINDGQRAELKEEIEAKREELKEERKEKLEHLKAKHSLKQAVRIYANISGLDVEELKAQYESGELTLDEVKLEVKAHFETLSDEEKEEAREKFNEEKTKLKIELKEKSEELREEAKERAQELRELRAQTRVDVRAQMRDAETTINASTQIEKFKELSPEKKKNLERLAMQKLIEKQDELTQEDIEKLQIIGSKFNSGEEINQEELIEVAAIMDIDIEQELEVN